ncbi:hypothetical protein [Paenibacillus luteus]|uniref:hypothetical protein n=1 Tax=Paenibacillus luteus TaxID=2545753 RepID=UPI001144FBB2|nr:hypothetical protein [Paenibacillus luteus]
MITMPSGIKKIEASDNVTVANQNRNEDLLDTKILAQNAHIGAGGAAHPVVTTTTAGFASAADKTKLDGVAAGANNYTHPSTHPPSIIVQDASNRFATDAEKAAWNAKASTAAATTTTAGLQSASDKSKLDGIESGANNYTHPATHPPSIIAQDTSNRFVTDAEKSGWNAKASTAVATTSAAGLQSASDKTKLDGVASGANNYTHPANHPPSIITQDASNRFVTDTEKATWNAKASTAYVDAARPYVTGTYTGDNAASRDIALPFTPSAVILFAASGSPGNTGYTFGGLAVSGGPVTGNQDGSGNQILSVGINKFTVISNNAVGPPYGASNSTGIAYRYIAFK